MRARWEALHASLERSVSRLEAQHEFQKLRASAEVFERFEEPSHVLAYLTGPGGNLDEKDAIYAALVTAFQAGACRGIASSLLWLGLWPALDGIYRRRLKLFPGQPEHLISEIGNHFTCAIDRADLTRIRRTAATLVRNAERLLIYAHGTRWEGWRKTLREDENSSDLCWDDSISDLLSTEQRELSAIVPAGVGVQAEIAALRAWLARFVGDDADLVIGAAIYEESQRETAERLKIPFDRARKRFQRAMDRLRKIVPPEIDVSQSAVGDRVSSASPEKGR